MSDAQIQVPDGVRALLARAEARRTQKAETRAAFARRRAAGLRRRHATKLARTS